MDLFLAIGKMLQFCLKKLSKWHASVMTARFRCKFEQRDDDIYIVTYPKSGTTLLQMMVYQLVTNGEMEFSHIYQVSPWLEEYINDPASLKKFKSPRIFKTHSSYKYFPKRFKGRIIYAMRNGMDVAESLYHHIKNYADPDLSWDKFLAVYFLTESTLKDDIFWFKHLADWLENRNELNVCYVRFEAVTANLAKTLTQLAAFLKVPLNEEILTRVVHRCDFKFMKTHQSKFGEQPRETKRTYDQFIRKGESNVGIKMFNSIQRIQYRKMYNKYLRHSRIDYDCES